MLFFSRAYLNSENKGAIYVGWNPYWYKYAFVNLFSTVGAHIGHSFKNTLRESAWMIYGYKWGLSIINLSLTIGFIRSAFVLVSACASKVRPFWFVTQDKTFYRYSRYLAVKCGDFLVLCFELGVWLLIMMLLTLLILLEGLSMFLCVRTSYMI